MIFDFRLRDAIYAHALPAGADQHAGTDTAPPLPSRASVVYRRAYCHAIILRVERSFTAFIIAFDAHAADASHFLAFRLPGGRRHFFLALDVEGDGAFPPCLMRVAIIEERYL